MLFLNSNTGTKIFKTVINAYTTQFIYMLVLIYFHIASKIIIQIWTFTTTDVNEPRRFKMTQTEVITFVL